MIPLASSMPSAAQHQVHFLVLRRAVDWLNRMIGGHSYKDLPADAWGSFEAGVLAPPLRLVADLVDLPDTAGTRGPTPFLGDSLRDRLADVRP